MSEIFQPCIEAVTNEYTTGDYFREVYEAKKAYFENLGNIAEDDPDFENQMDLFMSWYLFDRPLDKHEIPPVLLYYRKNLYPSEQLALYKALTETVHSVFELVKQKGASLVLKDLSGGDKYSVEDVKVQSGFSKGDLFEARLIPHAGSHVFANGFCFHPKDAYKFIEMQMQKIRETDPAQRTKLLLKLSQMRTKNQRFPHIDVKHIYTLTPKF